MLRISEEGEMLEMLSDPDGSKVAYISSTTEHDGALYFGNVREDYISVWPAMAEAEAAAGEDAVAPAEAEAEAAAGEDAVAPAEAEPEASDAEHND